MKAIYGKKFFALALAAVLTGSMLAGCGGKTDAPSNAGNDAGTEDGNDTQKDNSANSGADTSKGGENQGNSPSVAAQTFTFTTTYSENEYAGEIIKELNNQLQELSGGAIALDVYWGGTMAGAGEELAFVGDGGVDMSLIGQSQYTNVLSLLNFPSQVLTGYADSVALLDDIAFRNEATKDAVQAEIEANKVTMLGCMPGGSNAFITKKEYTSLAEMSGIKLGIGMNQSAMESLGFNVVSTMPWDYYDSLSRSIIDAGYMGTSALVSMSIQEVTPYFLADGTYTSGNFVTMNLDKWNSLDADTQDIFRQAVANTQEFACGRAAELDAEAASTIEAAGGKLNTANAEDAAQIQKAFFETGVVDARNYAAAAGTGDAMETVLTEVGKAVGLEVPAK